jgi:hypothetical protein
VEINNNNNNNNNNKTNNKAQPQKNVDFFCKKMQKWGAPVLGEVEAGTFGLKWERHHH